MAIYKQPNVKGIDINIQQFQGFVYLSLLAEWGLSLSWNCYDRAYKNQLKDGVIPEVYIGNSGSVAVSKDYQEVLINDSVAIQSFFILGDQVKITGKTATGQVSLIMMVDISKVKPTNSNRADEEIRNDVTRLCMTERYGFKISGIGTGIDQVFKEFSGWRKKQGIAGRDMYPFHCFRIDFDVAYSIYQ